MSKPTCPSPNPSPHLPAPRISPPITLPQHPFHTFHLMDCPATTDLARDLYLPALTKLNITHIVRISGDYDSTPFTQAGINVYNYPSFPDGSVPPTPSTWHTYLTSLPPSSILAIHCSSGIGRAPVLLAEALLHFGMYKKGGDAIEEVRRVRRGAMNKTQIGWLMARKNKKGLWKRIFGK